MLVFQRFRLVICYDVVRKQDAPRKLSLTVEVLLLYSGASKQKGVIILSFVTFVSTFLIRSPQDSCFLFLSASPTQYHYCVTAMLK